MGKIEDNLTIKDQQSIRYCGNCKREYDFDNFILNYPEIHHDKVMRLWSNQQIQFYCSYCYLLKIIKKIKKEKRLTGELGFPN